MRFLLVAAMITLAGCADPSMLDPNPSPGFAPQTGYDSDAAGGLVLEGHLAPCDGGHCINATARNDNDHAVHISNICVPPHRDAMQRDDKPLQHREPRYHCLAFGTRAMEPGEAVTFGYAWNGTVWDDDQQTLVPAEQGAYQWSVHFQAHQEEMGGDSIELTIEFTVVVGPT